MVGVGNNQIMVHITKFYFAKSARFGYPHSCARSYRTPWLASLGASAQKKIKFISLTW